MDLNKLLNPQSIAVIGASERPGFGLSTCTNLLKSHDTEHIYFVHPKHEYVLGRRCYPDIFQVPEQVDLCVIIVNKNLVAKTLEDAAACGCKAAIVYASGYGETGDKAAEEELRNLSVKLDMAIMGANCAGFMNCTNRVYPFGMLFTSARSGGIAIISQSGKICLNMSQVEYMGFSYLISSGNSTCLLIEDYIEFLIDDEHTKVIGLYMEGIKNPKKFEHVLAQAACKRKPIVILKVGRSEKGSRVAASHTGSLSGSDKAFDAVCKKFGVIRVDDIEELVQMCHILSVISQLPTCSGFAAMCLSGGETGVCADMGAAMGIKYPDFAPETTEHLKRLLPDYATPANPLDMTATLTRDKAKYSEVIETIMDDPNIGMVLCGQTVLPKQETSDAIYTMSEGMVNAASKQKKPIGLINFFNSSRDEVIRKRLEDAGIPLFPAAGEGFKLLRYLNEFREYNWEDRSLSLAIPEMQGGDKEVLGEHSSKQVLKEGGVKVPATILASTREEICKAAEKISYPAVVKIESPDILHKSDIGGVRLNLKNPEELTAACYEVLENARTNCPEAELKGVQIQEMLPAGTEFIIGVNTDPQFGPMIMVGMGGVFVEVFKDIQIYPAPVNRYEASEMLRGLKSYKLLCGYRGSEQADVEALTDLIVQISDFAVKHKNDLLELDLNPVFIHNKGEGVDIADALIIRRKEA
ncbi:MAG: acetate--CoA ligase family protein [Oscillospiraceae bacterium]|nr:acetate--CoA ligase family protein [Oscillospiraceae bacterium]